MEAMRQQLDLRDSFGLLRSIDERQGILEARHIAETLHIPFQPEDLEQYRQWTSTSQRNMVRILSRGTSGDTCLLRKELPSRMLLVDVLLRSNIFPLQHSVQRRGPILDALYRIYMGFYFRPHHLIMAALLYFEDKVHRKKLQQDDAIPLLFSRLLCHILEHMGYPTEPHLEHRHHCQEHFTLDQWTQLTEKNSAELAPEKPHPGQYLQYQHSLTRHSRTSIPQILFHPPLLHHLCLRPSLLILQLHHLTLNATHGTLFRKMRDIRAQQDRHSIILDQHTAILRQIQQHLGLAPPQTNIPGPSEPRAPTEETIPAEKTITADVPP
ncbi:hypothetical protein CK203_110315 [Vitis vinifera]|uniref:Uncharacterized protein n=1 Tax=Vitis vinifera TaxID=29760 RepID=A0A438CVU7_VITVI|nr:hypothetical protein CK203_110315 [Vitis vinifera]